MLDNYVYKNLERFGNAIIGEEDYKKLGRKNILNDLKEHGFKCKFKIIKYHVIEHGFQWEPIVRLDRTYIVEVV